MKDVCIILVLRFALPDPLGAAQSWKVVTMPGLGQYGSETHSTLAIKTTKYLVPGEGSRHQVRSMFTSTSLDLARV